MGRGGFGSYDYASSQVRFEDEGRCNLVFGLWQQQLVAVFFANHGPCFLWDFRILFSQVNLLDTSNCTLFN